MAKRVPLLVLGPVSRPYGYARVISSVLPHLTGRYEIHQFGLDIREPVADALWTIHPNRLSGDPFGIEQLPALIESIHPRVLWIVNDISLYLMHRRTLSKLGDDQKVVLYCPIDGTDVDPAWIRALRHLSRLVVFTTFARREVTAVAARLTECESFPPVAVVPHGLDVRTFKPCATDNAGGGFQASRCRARELLFPDQPELRDAFIVLNANQNNSRKRIDLTIHSFSLFARDKPAHVRLYLHMPSKPLAGCSLMPVAREYGVADRLLLTTGDNGVPHVSDRHLNLIYSACDVGVNTSTGEGWGLVAFEHAATGAPQVLPRHSACEALWRDAAVLVDTERTRRGRLDIAQHRAVTPAGIAAALQHLYSDPAFRAGCAMAAYANASRPEYRWERIAAQWDALIADVLHPMR